MEQVKSVRARYVKREGDDGMGLKYPQKEIACDWGRGRCGFAFAHTFSDETSPKTQLFKYAFQSESKIYLVTGRTRKISKTMSSQVFNREEIV